MSETLMDRVGVMIFPWGKAPPTVQSLVETATIAERLGFDSVHIPWHYTVPKSRFFPAFENRYCLDPTVVFPVIAHQTKRVKLCFNSAVLPLLHPYHWAKWFASMDVISAGRFIGGIAVGWWEEDFLAAGASLRKRGQRFDEGLQLLRDLLDGRAVSVEGEFYDGRGLEIWPRPIQEPLPLLIGGGERSIARAARADAVLCPINPSVVEVGTSLRPKVDAAFGEVGTTGALWDFTYSVIEEDEEQLRNFHRPRILSRLNELSLEDARRLADSETMDIIQPEGRVLWGDPAACATQLVGLIDAGIDYFVFDFHYHGLEPEEYGREQMERFVGEVIPLAEERLAQR